MRFGIVGLMGVMPVLNRRAKRTVLSTHYYGGKNTMRKIFIKKMKKNGNSILICAAVFTISIGTMTGCSMTKENAEAVSDQSDQSDQSESENILPVEESTADNAILENTPVPETSEEKVEKTEKVAEAAEVEKAEKAGVAEKTEAVEKTEEVEKTEKEAEAEKTDKEYTEDKMVLKIMREGEMEEIPATLLAGDGYVIYLTDGDWQQHATDAWTAAFEGKIVLNGQAQLWITHYDDKTGDRVKEELKSAGYTLENSDMTRQEGEVIYKVRLNEFENDVWGVNYCYPIEAEEGWGALLPLIADTFAVSMDDQ